MKNNCFLILLIIALAANLNAQVITPKASPLCKLEQKVGLTDIAISYSRPAVNKRIIFGDLVPYDQFWRLGANENTKLVCSDLLIFGIDTLPAGTYAMYAKPSKGFWELVFYKDYSNWGLPEKWEDSKVVLSMVTSTRILNDHTENLFIGIDNITNNNAILTIKWDKLEVWFPFSVNSKEKVLASIEKTMKGPTANDYNQAATYYYNEKLDMKQALEWSIKAVEMRGVSAYWMTRMKSLLQAANGDYVGAIETAEICIKEAEKDNDMTYVNASKKSIEEWKNKK